MSVGTDREHTKSVHIQTKGATLKETESGDTKITVPVSGLSEDRDGDKFSSDGVEALVSQLNDQSIPMFPNHGLSTDTGGFEYRYQDMMGKWEQAEQNDDIVEATATLREGDENAEALKDLLAQEMPVGFSVGFGWDESDAEERDTGGFEFHDADLMEISPVGIPSHPEAVVQASNRVAEAMKAAGLNPSEDMDNVEITVNEMTEKETTESEDTETEGTETESETEETETEDSTEKEEQKQATVEVSAVMDAINAHMMALEEDLAEMADGETEELDEMDDEEEEEETESEDGEDDEEDKVAELRTLVEEQDSQIDELKAELETVKTETAETSERKGGMETAEKEESEETKDRQTPEEFAKNIV